MAAKSKKILLQNLNILILDTLLKDNDASASVADLKKQWESPEFQKKMAVDVFGIKSKNLTPGPKRNKSAYMFFCQDMRQKIVAENSECKPHQIMSLLGSKWRELTTKQKSQYYEQAAEDKERYLDMKELEKGGIRPRASFLPTFCFARMKDP